MPAATTSATTISKTAPQPSPQPISQFLAFGKLTEVIGRSFSWQGEVYHENIDPRTGYPAVGTASVTVLHDNASTADAAATALFIAGPKDWHRVSRQMGIRYVMLTDKERRVHMNPDMQARVKLQHSNHKVIISEPLA